ncbi:MAG: hypothetical protein LUG93_10270 [Lachnospiraceae bacterium]|nr:hypothetical protein [Lachnospiraceae bacterium]
MNYSMRECQVCVCKGKTRQDALEEALGWMNGFLIGGSYWLVPESTSVQYEKLAEDDGYNCILTFIYKRKNSF